VTPPSAPGPYGFPGGPTLISNLPRHPIIRFDAVDLARRRLAQDKNNLINVTGETGSGKSMVCLDFARKYDPTFCLDDIVFTVRDFLDRIKELKDARETYGKMLVFEEVGIGADSRESMSKKNIHFGHVLKLFRYLNISAAFNVQNMEMFDINGRRLTHFHISMAGINRRLKRAKTHFFIVDSHHSFGGEPKYFFPKLEIKNFNMVVQVDPVYFNLPPDRLITPYKKKKDDFTEDLFEKTDKLFSSDGKGREKVPENISPFPLPRPLPSRKVAPNDSAPIKF
jgi:hypothetical protein